MSSKTYRVGILGAGYIAAWHVQALRRIPNVELVAVCDLSQARATALAEAHGIGHTYTSLEKMLDEQELDVVHVLLPPGAHYSSAKTLIDRGVHILMEKPYCISAAQCSDLTELADQAGVRIGVGHNFLFSEPYQQLLTDLKAGRLGPLNHIDITWSKELGPLTSGPRQPWLFESPENVLLEVGPHSVAHLLHLLGEPEEINVLASDAVEFEGVGATYRSWLVHGRRADTTFSMRWGFNASDEEHSIRIQGRVASAELNFERNSYVLREHTKYGLDFDRYMMVRSETRQMREQARNQFLNYALSKARLSDKGNSFGFSIAEALRSFYHTLDGAIDQRLSPEFATHVIECCHWIGGEVSVESSRAKARKMTEQLEADTLILGGSGFIGRALVERLADAGKKLRLICRNPSALPAELIRPNVQIIKGDLRDPELVESALEGIDTVYHLARANVSSWDDYYKQDVLVTERIADLCLAKGVKRLIYTGTIATYYSGAKAGRIDESTGVHPQIQRCNNYARAKAACEDLLLKMHKEKGLPVVIFRPGIVLGSGSSPFHWGVGMWKWNSVCQLWGDGKNPLPLVLVDDVVDALVAGADKPGVEGQSYNLIGDVRLTGQDYLNALSDASGIRIRACPTPIWKFFAVDLAKWMVKVAVRHPERIQPCYRDWEARTQLATYDCSKVKSDLDWKPESCRQTVIEKGIRLPSKEWLHGE